MKENKDIVLNYNDLSKDELLIREVLLCARNMEEYLFGEESLVNKPFKKDVWVEVFQKLVNKIMDIDISNPSYEVELRKRIVQQAALSVKALVALDKNRSKSG